MNNYLKLVNFELSRFVKIYIVLIGITIVSQIVGVIVKSKSYLSEANKVIYEDLIPKAQFMEETGPMSMMNVTTSLWFMGPFALCIAVLIIYIFLIWYRDWFGKNTFIYRLLMLPTARLNVFLAKATAIFLMVLGLISLQLLLLPVESTVLKWVVPKDFRMDMSVEGIIHSFGYLQILVPQSFMEFMIHYGIGFMVVFIVFTAILFERSFHWKGVLLGVGYGAFSIVLFTSPFLVELIFQVEYLYPIELLLVEVVLGLVVIAMSIWMSNFLLKKKITV